MKLVNNVEKIISEDSNSCQNADFIHSLHVIPTHKAENGSLNAGLVDLIYILEQSIFTYLLFYKIISRPPFSKS